MKTIKQKAKCYDEALDRARVYWETDNDNTLDIKAKGTMEYLFPELAESDDERIRKVAIEFVKQNTSFNYCLGISKEQILDWLKKQGKLVDEYEDKLDRCACESFNKGYKAAIEHQKEKQGEKKSKKVSLWKHWKDGIAGNGEGKLIYLVKVNGTYRLTSCLSFECDYIKLSELDTLMFEKQDKQNVIEALRTEYEKGRADAIAEAGKVEPKFHEGEWVFIEEIKGYKQGPFQIKSLSKHGYCFDEDRVMPFSTDDLMSLWTIQDAKDGDVLRIRNLTFIFQEITNNNVCHKDAVVAYCSYEDNDDGFGVCGPDCITDLEIITPATKEQRNLLFQKMREAGYEWNAEKKELKKIKDEEYNGEDYGIDSLFHAQRILEKTLGKVDGYQSDDGILEHKCAISAVKKLYGQKPSEWSEEDERMIRKIIYDLDYLKKECCDDHYEGSRDRNPYHYSELINWLKSLKDRVQPQPRQEWSEEDEKYIASIIKMVEHCSFSSISGITKAAAVAWLKSPRPQKQWKSANWSEEEQQIIEDAACCILDCVNTAETKKEEERLEKLADKLQDLRLQKQWKPTKEQLYMLNWLATNVLDDGATGKAAKEVLYSLYEQLKNL